MSDITSFKKNYQEGKLMSFDHLKEANKPVTPFQQLLSILPKASRKLLPDAYSTLYDSSSEIIDLYPEHYNIDFNGRALPWEAIKLIPFVDVNRIIEAEKKTLKPNQFTVSELQRNSLHRPFQYIYLRSANGPKVSTDLKDMLGFQILNASNKNLLLWELSQIKNIVFSQY